MSDIQRLNTERRTRYINQRLRGNLVRLVPMCLLLGGCMELFMLNTGFYDVVKRKEAEKIIEQRIEQTK
jgi:hypothetical protein